MENKSPEAFRTISEVAHWLGVPTHVLRFWESRFTHVKPVKRAGGRRYYRPADMLLLGGIKRLLHDDGLTIRGVQKLLREQGVRHVAALSPDLAPGDRDAPLALPVSPAGRVENVGAAAPPQDADARPYSETVVDGEEAVDVEAGQAREGGEGDDAAADGAGADPTVVPFAPGGSGRAPDDAGMRAPPMASKPGAGSRAANEAAGDGVDSAKDVAEDESADDTATAGDLFTRSPDTADDQSPMPVAAASEPADAFAAPDRPKSRVPGATPDAVQSVGAAPPDPRPLDTHATGTGAESPPAASSHPASGDGDGDAETASDTAAPAGRAAASSAKPPFSTPARTAIGRRLRAMPPQRLAQHRAELATAMQRLRDLRARRATDGAPDAGR